MTTTITNSEEKIFTITNNNKRKVNYIKNKVSCTKSQTEDFHHDDIEKPGIAEASAEDACHLWERNLLERGRVLKNYS
jgi:hypothetical protein